MSVNDPGKAIWSVLTRDAAAYSETDVQDCEAVLRSLIALGENSFSGSMDAHMEALVQKTGLSAPQVSRILEGINHTVGSMRARAPELADEYLDEEDDADSAEDVAKAVLEQQADAIAERLGQPPETCYLILAAFDKRCEDSPSTTFAEDVAFLSEDTGFSSALIEQVLDALDAILEEEQKNR